MVGLPALLARYQPALPLPALPVTDVCQNSAQAMPGVAFFCLRGSHTDGHRYAADAYARGARIFFTEERLPLPADAWQWVLPDTRRAYALACAAFFGNPADAMTLIGITGTKGKTTTAAYLHAILQQGGIPAGLIGTAGMKIGDLALPPAENTTPDSRILHAHLAKMRKAGISVAVLEVSSQAVWQSRVAGLRFDRAIFTNLSYDHIGEREHPDFAHYKACKKSVFSVCRLGFLNRADAAAEEFAAVCPAYRTYAVAEDADYTADHLRPFSAPACLGITFTAKERAGVRAPGSAESTQEILLQNGGAHNVQNALAAIACARDLGIGWETIAHALETVTVCGRGEVTDVDGIRVIIDYAHNAAALEAILHTLRAYRPQRLFCLFGSVGERTKCRRYAMGAVAAMGADYCILTSDDPGTEAPEEILREIASAFEERPKACPFQIIPDRATAIRTVMEMARPGDFVLLAGKGHEKTQHIGERHIPFCERELVLSFAKSAPS